MTHAMNSSLNDGDLIERLKRTPLPPEWRRGYGHTHGTPGSGTVAPVHPDPAFSDVVWKSRSMLKKAMRIQRYNGNHISKRNQSRLVQAVRDITHINSVSLMGMAKEMVADRVARLVLPDTTDLSGLLERIIREEVQRALNKDGIKGKTLEGVIQKIALDEARRLVVENLNIELSVNGRVFTNKDGRRAVSLGDD